MDAYEEYVERKHQSEEAASKAQPKVASRQTRITRRGWWVIGIVAFFVLISIYEAVKPKGPSKAVAAYCKTIQVGHTTALNTETSLGQPDTSVTHQGTLYLGYGSVTFYYDILGALDADTLAGKQGC